MRYDPPAMPWSGGERGIDGVRVDDGVAEGGEVSMFYDPMIAKLITWSDTRDAAAELQVDALDRFRIGGPGHNLHFLSAIMQHPRFRAGDLTTGFITEEWPDGFAGAPADEERLRLLAALFAGAECTWRARAGRISGKIDGAPPPGSDWTVRLHGREFAVTLGDGGATVDGEWIGGTWDWQPGRWLSTARSDEGNELAVQLSRDGVHWRISTRGAEHRALVLPVSVAPLAAHMIEKVPLDLSRFAISPMPGLLVALHVSEGDEVQPGQPLATIEAMKMENVLRAEKAGTVKVVNAAQGASLALDQVIIEIE
jgi:propionyl-CoA carboxylase alpha chain